MKKALDLIINGRKNITIISGRAKGADILGEKYAIENNLNIIEKPADWNKFGLSAGYIRNEEMAQIADIIVCFHDGKSNGTQHMINLGIKYKIPVYIINYKERTVIRK